MTNAIGRMSDLIIAPFLYAANSDGKTYSPQENIKINIITEKSYHAYMLHAIFINLFKINWLYVVFLWLFTV